MSGIKLQGANLFRAQLQGANLGEAQLQGADLSGAQGAKINATEIVGIFYPPSSSVFSTEEVQYMFNETQPDWGQLEAIAREIQDAKTKKSYLDRISEAKNKPSVDAKTSWKHNPSEIAKEAFPDVCTAGLESTRAFRSSYQGMANYYITEERLKERIKNP